MGWASRERGKIERGRSWREGGREGSRQQDETKRSVVACASIGLQSAFYASGLAKRCTPKTHITSPPLEDDVEPPSGRTS